MKSSLLIFFLLLPTTFGYAQIYQCKDESGKTIFKDSECGNDAGIIRARGTDDDLSVSEDGTVVDKVPQNKFISDNKPGKLIFSDTSPLSSPYTIKVNEVRLITETKDTLVVDVIYTYEHDIPANEVKIYVIPNHGYWSANPIQVSKGHHVGRASIGLSSRNMNKNRVTRSFTNTITIRFGHYAPEKYKGIIWSETVRYEKNWKLKLK